MGPIPLRFDVTDALNAEVTRNGLGGSERLEIAAWLFVPDDVALLGARPRTLVLLAGGSYDKRYHHVVIPGREGYSAAEHFARAGFIVLLPDHLGVGESSRAPVQKLASPQVVAAANHAAVSQFYARLARGDLHSALPPLPAIRKFGGGHSMGAMQTVFQQAAHRTYDAIAFLGYTVQTVHFYHGTTRVCAGDFIPDDPPDYAVNDRAAQHYNFHWDDVPADVIAADDALAVPTPTRIGLDSIRRDIIKAEAARISVPVFFGNGERDVSPDPRAEAGFFPLCSDFTMFLLPKSAHCQSFAGTRQMFWDRIIGWTESLKI